MGASDPGELLRAPAHAGTFYPGSADALARLVDAQLDAARAAAPGHAASARDAGAPVPDTREDQPAGLVVPHAGLQYSGPVAAAAWASLGRRSPEAIVIAGTNHYIGGLDGIAVWPAGAWRTPIGDVPVAADLADAVIALGEPFRAAPRAHHREHSIEVQLPFIVRACPGSAIVPLLVSFDEVDAGLDAGSSVGRLLGGLRAAGRDVVLVASTDFAHYPAAADAAAVTRALLPALVAKDAAALVRREAELRFSGMAGLACGMCGIEPAAFALAAFGTMGLGDGVVLATATSADVPGGDPYRTVGYAAIAYPPRPGPVFA